jgi:hypothetical protein
MLLTSVLEICEVFAEMSEKCRRQIMATANGKRLKVTVPRDDVLDHILPLFGKIRCAAEDSNDHYLKRETKTLIRKLWNWVDKQDEKEESAEPSMERISWEQFHERCPVAREALAALRDSETREYDFVLAMEGPGIYDVRFRWRGSTSHLMDLRLTVRDSPEGWTLEIEERCPTSDNAPVETLS